MNCRRVISIDTAGRAVSAMFADGVLADVTPDFGPPINAKAGHAQSDIPTWVIVPGQDVLTRLIDLPPGAETNAANALPFLLEDDVATGVDGLHFALGTQVVSGQRCVGVVARDKIKRWLAQLHDGAVSADVICPDYFAIPKHVGRMVVVFRAGTAVVGLPSGTGLSAESAVLEMLLPAAVASTPAMDVDVYGAASEISAVQKLLPRLHIVGHAPFSEREFLQAAYRRLEARVDLNLRHGAFALGRQWRLNLQPWRRAAALLLAFVGLATAYQAVAGVRYNIEAGKAMAQAERIARDILPPGTRLVNARAQVKAQLQSLRAGSSDNFIVLSEVLAESMKASGDGALEALQFDHERGGIAASVAAPTFDAIEKLKAEIKGRGAIVEDGEARQSGLFIVGELSVRLP